MKISPFMFEKFWLRRPDIEEVVARSWSKFTSSSPTFCISKKIQQLKLDLKA